MELVQRRNRDCELLMIEVETIFDSEFDSLIQTFDDQSRHLKLQFDNQIELKSYGSLLRLGLNVIRDEAFDSLLERIEVNRELETALDNVGGYTIDALGQQNPKTTLKAIIECAKTKALKINNLVKYLSEHPTQKSIVADKSDVAYLTNLSKNYKTNICTIKELKKQMHFNEILIFYSFNGGRDFEYLYNLSANIVLILFQQEHELYKKQLQKRKIDIENEITSSDRLSISGIQYEPLPNIPIHLSEAIEEIVNRLDERRNADYNSYREEADILLDEIDENTTYEIQFENEHVDKINSNETVFTETNDLIRGNRIEIGDKIRVYPNEQFAETLYRVAVETDEEVFGTIEDDSKRWRSYLIELKEYYRDGLYALLKTEGLKVLQSTVENYFDESVKFPQHDSTLKAIFKLKFKSISDKDIDYMLAPIRKSKSTYNSTMIALGRGLKQEIKLFLKENRIGEILEKLQFNIATLQKFVDDYMPLLTVKNKKIYKSNTEIIEELLTRLRK